MFVHKMGVLKSCVVVLGGRRLFHWKLAVRVFEVRLAICKDTGKLCKVLGPNSSERSELGPEKLHPDRDNCRFPD